MSVFESGRCLDISE